MRRTIVTLSWLLLDLLLFTGAYALAYFLRVGWIFSTDFPFGNFMRIVVLIAPAWLIVLITTRTFTLTRNQATLQSALRTAYACIVGAALFALAYYFVYGLFFSRLLLIGAFLLSFLCTVLCHAFFEKFQRYVLTRDPPAYPTLIVGATRESRELIAALKKRRNPLTPVAILTNDPTPEKDIAEVPILGRLHKLEEVFRQMHITHLIQASDLEQSLNLLSACRSHNITYLLLPSVLGIVERDERIESLEGLPITVVSPRKHWLHTFF